MIPSDYKFHENTQLINRLKMDKEFKAIFDLKKISFVPDIERMKVKLREFSQAHCRSMISKDNKSDSEADGYDLLKFYEQFYAFVDKISKFPTIFDMEFNTKHVYTFHDDKPATWELPKKLNLLDKFLQRREVYERELANLSKKRNKEITLDLENERVRNRILQDRLNSKGATEIGRPKGLKHEEFFFGLIEYRDTQKYTNGITPSKVISDYIALCKQQGKPYSSKTAIVNFFKKVVSEGQLFDCTDCFDRLNPPQPMEAFMKLPSRRAHPLMTAYKTGTRNKRLS